MVYLFMRTEGSALLRSSRRKGNGIDDVGFKVLFWTRGEFCLLCKVGADTIIKPFGL